MLNRFSTFFVSTVCILAALTIKTGDANREGILRDVVRSFEHQSYGGESRNILLRGV